MKHAGKQSPAVTPHQADGRERRTTGRCRHIEPVSSFEHDKACSLYYCTTNYYYRMVRKTPGLSAAFSDDFRYLSVICLVTLLSLASSTALKGSEQPESDFIWSQSFYYAIWATILYFLVASLLVFTFWGAHSGHYSKDFNLSTSQRTLMLQTIVFLAHLLVGALVFSAAEDWAYLDAVYWADVTIFTVGFGDFAPTTTLGRALLFPYALIGIISLALIITSIRTMLIERGRQQIHARVQERVRRRVVQRVCLSDKNNILTPVTVDAGATDTPAPELKRRRSEFNLMREIQRKASRRRRWTAFFVSAACWITLLLLGAFVFSKCEKSYGNWTYYESFYFSYVALLTIGYGDFAPTSNSGRSFFVFWSLLALPSATILISSAGDTVGSVIQDMTILLGSVTILPAEDDFNHSLKRLIHRFTFGQVFPRSHGTIHDIESHGPPRRTHTPRPSHVSRLRERKMGAAKCDTPSKLINSATHSERWRGPDQNPLPVHQTHLDNFPTGHDLSILLVSEIEAVAKHIRESKTRRYTFDEWAWYLRLIGEHEDDPRSHRKMLAFENRQQVFQRRYDHKKWKKGKMQARADGLEQLPSIVDEGEQRKWSWVDDQSPLSGVKEESEWILAQLVHKLKESLWLTKDKLDRAPSESA